MRRHFAVAVCLIALLSMGCGRATSDEADDLEPSPTAVSGTPASATPTPTATPFPLLTSELSMSFWSGPLDLFPLSLQLRPGRQPDTSSWRVDLSGIRFTCTPTPSNTGWLLDDCTSTLPNLELALDVPRNPEAVMTVDLADYSVDPPMIASGSTRLVRERDEETASHVTRQWQTRASNGRGTADVWSADGVVYAANLGGYVELLSGDSGERLSLIDLNVIAGVDGPSAAAFDVKVRSGLLYIATAGLGLLIYDVSDPTQPTFAGTYAVRPTLDASPDAVWSLHNIFLAPQRDILYLINQSPSSQDLRLLDVSDPAAPFEVGRYSVENPLEEDLFAHDVNVVIQDGREIAYLNYWDAGLRILDTTDPAAIVELGFWDDEGVHSHAGWPFELDSRRYYAHGGEGYDQGLTVVDVTDPASPLVVGHYKSRDGISIHNVEVRDGLAYIAYYLDGLRVVDLSDPTMPVEVAHYDTVRTQDERDLFGGAWGIRLDGDRVFVSDRQSGVFAFAVELPSD